MKVTEIGVKLCGVYVVCPHCNKELDGWCVDPRGETTTCDFCDKEFKIHSDADLELL